MATAYFAGLEGDVRVQNNTILVRAKPYPFGRTILGGRASLIPDIA